MLVIPLDDQPQLRFPEIIKCAIAIILQTAQTTKSSLKHNYTGMVLIIRDQSLNLFGCLKPRVAWQTVNLVFIWLLADSSVRVRVPYKLSPSGQFLANHRVILALKRGALAPGSRGCGLGFSSKKRLAEEELRRGQRYWRVRIIDPLCCHFDC